jgi:hypothetical protein
MYAATAPGGPRQRPRWLRDRHGEKIGSGWGGFTALLAPGDFSGDGNNDILARRSDGSLLRYGGEGDSGFAGGAVKIGSG